MIGVQVVNELLNGVRIVKYYAWERPFAAKIEAIRKKEMGVLLSFNRYVMVAFTVLSGSTVIVMTLIVFLMYVVVCQPPNAPRPGRGMRVYSHAYMPVLVQLHPRHRRQPHAGSSVHHHPAVCSHPRPPHGAAARRCRHAASIRRR